MNMSVTSCFWLNTAVALFLGMLIGMERQWRQHAAGLRTNALVALGAALFVSLSYLMNDTYGPTRIPSYVVSGLGFLGGGVILRDGLNVKGLNTAATIWCSGAVGCLAGAGYLLEACWGTLAVLLVHLGLRPVVRWIDLHTRIVADVETYYRLRIVTTYDRDTQIRHILLRHINGHGRLTLQGLSTEDNPDGQVVVIANIYALERNDRALEDIVARVSLEPEVKAVSWQRATG
jgi:putative Mg2+ transporter-C (MgtC) family protein